MIMRDHPEVPGKCLHLIGPECAAPAKPRHQQKIGTAASYLDMDFSIANIDGPDFSRDCFDRDHGAMLSDSSPC